MRNAITVVFACCCALANAQTIAVHGRVVDSANAVVQHASIDGSIAGRALHTETNDRGEFSLAVPSLPIDLRISAPGFDPVIQKVSSAETVVFRLDPAHRDELVEVTTSRFSQPRANSAAGL